MKDTLFLRTEHMDEDVLRDVCLALYESTNELVKRPDPLAFEKGTIKKSNLTILKPKYRFKLTFVTSSAKTGTSLLLSSDTKSSFSWTQIFGECGLINSHQKHNNMPLDPSGLVKSTLANFAHDRGLPIWSDKVDI
ncbi:unnamed protein product [Rhizophagus irregularis]|nr:unnamed protein product [Rhizophagus irregularis]